MLKYKPNEKTELETYLELQHEERLAGNKLVMDFLGYILIFAAIMFIILLFSGGLEPTVCLPAELFTK